jgi:AcrR family transcriptional regulator
MSSADKKEIILQAAEQLFADQGFKATSTRALAEKAGVNLGMLSYYFGSKDKILEAVMERKVGFFRVNAGVRIKDHHSAWEKLDTMMDIYLEYFLSNVRFTKMLTTEMGNCENMEMKQNIMKIMAKNARQFQQVIEDGIEQKAFRKVDVEFTFMAFLATIMHYIRNERMALLMIGQDPDKHSILDKQNVTRLRAFLHNYLHTQLKP